MNQQVTHEVANRLLNTSEKVYHELSHQQQGQTQAQPQQPIKVDQLTPQAVQGTKDAILINDYGAHQDVTSKLRDVDARVNEGLTHLKDEKWVGDLQQRQTALADKIAQRVTEKHPHLNQNPKQKQAAQQKAAQQQKPPTQQPKPKAVARRR